MNKVGQLLICLLPLGIALGFAAWSKHDKREKVNYQRDQAVLDAQAEALKAKAEAEKMKAELEVERAALQKRYQDRLDLSNRQN